ncbi:MAG: sigma 54-interacting transcriptional regulator [bacterium]
MKEVVTTDFQKDILDTAALMIQPFDVNWLAKAIRKPRRGVINQVGRLCKLGVLRPCRTGELYQFSDNMSLEKIETGIPDEKKKSIYNSLWNAIQATPTHKSSTMAYFQKAWAASKADAPDAVELISDALRYAFKLVDDILADSIFLLSEEKWPEELPKPIFLRKAEYAFLKGNSYEAQILINRLLNDSGTPPNIKTQAEILKIRICVQEDSEYSGANQLKQLLELNADPSAIHELLVQTVENYQESGCGAVAETLLESSYFKEFPNKMIEAEFYWLKGRQSLLNGDLEKAIQYFQKALITTEKHIDRSLAARIMMDVARVHGISGNTTREHNCLRLVAHLIHRGKREYLHGKMSLYILEKALEAGSLKEAGDIIYKILQNCPGEFGQYHFAVALYGGLVLAGRLNLTRHSASYLNELMVHFKKVPSELFLRIYHVLDDLTAFFPDQCSHLQVIIRQTVMQNCRVFQPCLSEGFNFDITYSIAAFLRQSQLTSDLLMQEYRQSDGQNYKALEQAAWLAQKIGDQKRDSEFKQVLIQQQNKSEESIESQYGSFVLTLLNTQTYEQYQNAVQLFFSDNFGVESGVFLLIQKTRFEWHEGWGKKPGLKDQRAIIRAIERMDRIKGSKIAFANSWVCVSLPPLIRYGGYLLLKTDHVNWTSEKEKLLNILVKPIAIMRQIILDQVHRAESVFLPGKDHADKLIGKSPQIQELRNKIRRIANSPTTVHISGETGTGKELIAEAIHYCGSRKDRPFIPFNCSTGPEALIESELFGHKRGAFTGAVEARKGIFQMAQGGTVFLDEIADLPLSVQAKLLRVLQEKKIRPLGSDEDLSVDVRIISATHKHLDEEVKKGRFRSDLFYRLVVLHLQAPSLRERPEDVPVLAAYFLKDAIAKIGPANVNFTHDAIKWLSSRYWPGNVRELQNLIEAAANFVDTNGTIDVADLKKWAKSTVEYPNVTLADAIEKYQVELIRKVLDSCDGSVTLSAKKLGVTRQTLNKKLKSIDLQKSITQGFERNE